MKIKKYLGTAIIIVMVLIGLASAKNSLAIEYGMLGGRPANPNPNVENGDSWFIYNLKPGDKIEDGIQVMNLFDAPNSILLYAADTTPSSSGGFALKQFSESKDEVGSWVKFYPDAVPEMFQSLFDSKDKKIIDFCAISREDMEKTFVSEKKKLTDDDFAKFSEWCAGKSDMKIDLKGNERLTVPFVFSVPDSADVGEHTGGILIQKVGADDTQAGGSAVKLTTRVGVRIYETVPGAIIRKITVTGTSIAKNFGELDFSNWFKPKDERKAEEYSFVANILNEGNVSATIQDVIHIKDNLFGRRNVDVEDRSFQVLKNTTFDSNFSWNNPRFGRFTFEREIGYTDANGNKQAIKLDPVSFWIIPWREISVALALLAIIAGAYVFWKRANKKRYGGVGWVEHVVKKTDTVAKLAEKHNIDWKVLVKTNKIKAPYLLGAGNVILVPPSMIRGKAGRKSNKGNGAKPIDVIPKSAGKDMVKKPAKAKKAVEGKDGNKLDNIVKLARKKTERPQVETMPGRFTRKKVIIVVGIAILLIVFSAIGISIVVRSVYNKDKAVSEKISINSVMPVEQPDDSSDGSSPTDDKASVPAEETIDAAGLGIKVLNEGGPVGLAGKVKAALVGEGYAKATAGNGAIDTVSGNFIYYSADKYKEIAGKIGDFLRTRKIEAQIMSAQTDEQKSSDVVVVLGK